jgi:hypothetical protein
MQPSASPAALAPAPTAASGEGSKAGENSGAKPSGPVSQFTNSRIPWAQLMLRESHRLVPNVPFLLHRLDLGPDVVLVGMEGEMMAEYQLRLQQRWPQVRRERRTDPLRAAVR